MAAGVYALIGQASDGGWWWSVNWADTNSVYLHGKTFTKWGAMRAARRVLRRRERSTSGVRYELNGRKLRPMTEA